MLITATTVMDSPANVRFFVGANLASGVDHMIVFLDSPRAADQREVGAFLDEHPRVTCVRTGKAWWQGDRPGGLNVRQRINANWARAVLEPFEWAEWLFHVDGDEVARLDREALAEVPASVAAVWLAPLEAVSEMEPAARPTRFKRLLGRADLTLLHVLGAVPAATNQAYFHGHVMGKSGVRPASGLGLTLHEPVTPAGERPDRHEDERLAVLHYDAISGEEFVRKWSALARAGHARYRKDRAPAARALRALLAKDLPDGVREKYLRRLYELTTLDDVALLDELGLLVTVDPEQQPTAPRDLPAGAADQLADRVAELGQVPKRDFFVADRLRDEDRPGQPGSRGRRLRGLGRRS